MEHVLTQHQLQLSRIKKTKVTVLLWEHLMSKLSQNFLQ